MPESPHIIDDKYDIIFTKVDEAPSLASYSLLPIIHKFLSVSGIKVGFRDISLAARILAKFPERLLPDQRVEDELTQLGELAKTPQANIIKLPNISATIPQLKNVIQELQQKGFAVPDFNEAPKTIEEHEIFNRYTKVLGSAVNPVLREGNSDRRAPKAVKAFAMKNPHKMGSWTKRSQTHVSTMQKNDFRNNEKSLTVTDELSGEAKFEFVDQKGVITALGESMQLECGAVIDATMMSVTALKMFYKEQIEDAKTRGILFSVHLKATMMKISDPVLFGYAVEVFLEDVFVKHSEIFAKIGVNPNNGLGDLIARIEALPSLLRNEITKDIENCFEARPTIHMVDSDNGITNLHVPNDVIIDASMPAVIKSGGKGWAANGSEADIKCVIPDSTYADVYAETIKFCIKNGAFDPTEMGSVSNIGLMAQKAEEYGSHSRTFLAPGAGAIRVCDTKGNILIQHDVDRGDIWRLCEAKDAPIRNWVQLAISRARQSGHPAIFWLDHTRPHDVEIIKKVREEFTQAEIEGLNIQIMSPKEATKFSLDRVKKGLNTISVTGNVLRDYLTDLFPILELGTSAKMLSIVPLMNGGGLFETGAAGSAPKHVIQFIKEGHLRWDSLGEFTALAASLEQLNLYTKNATAKILSKTLDVATKKILDRGKSPKRNVGELDSRGSHFYLALYWAEELSNQKLDGELQNTFRALYESLKNGESAIMRELEKPQGSPALIGGYYLPDPRLVSEIMRPSAIFNRIIDTQEEL